MDNKRKTKAELLVEVEKLQHRISELESAGTKRGAEELREQLTLLFQHMPINFTLQEIIFDETSKPIDFRYIGINPAAASIMGKVPADILGKKNSELFPGTPQAWIDKFAAIGLTGTSEHYETYSKDLKRYFEIYNYSPQTGRVATLGVDITERKQMEEKLRESEINLNTLIENTDGSIWAVDVNYGLIVGNEEFHRNTSAVFGRRLNKGENVINPAFKPEANTEWQGYYDRALKGESFSVEMLTRFRAEPRHIEYRFSPIREIDGSIHGVTVYGRDITERKQAEEKLRENELRYKSLYNNTPVMMYSTDPQGKLISVSDYWLQSMGYTREEVLGRLSTDFLTEDSQRYARETVLPHFLQSGHCENVSYQFIKKNGECIDTLLSAISEKDAEGRVTRSLAVMVDITERRQADKRLQNSEQKLRIATQESLDGFVLVDNKGIIVEWNPANEQITGLLRDQAIGKFYWDVQYQLLSKEKQSSEALARSKSMIQQALQTGNAPFLNQLMEIEFVAQDGEKHFVRQFVRPIKTAEGFWLAGTTHDFTDRRRMEKALKESEEFLNESQRIANMGSWEFDLIHNKVHWSENCYALYGFKPNEIEPSFDYFKSVVHPNDVRIVNSAFEDAIRNHKPSMTELRIVFPDGAIKWLQNNMVPVLENGQITKLKGIQIDITTRKQAEEALQKSEAQLASAMKIAKLGHWELDIESGMFTFSDSLYDIFRTTAGKVGGYQMPIADYARRFVHPEDALLVEAETRKAIETTDPNFNRRVEHRMLYADGSVGYIAVHYFIIKDQQGRTIKTYGVNQDITEHKQAEEKLHQNEELFRSLFETMAQGVVYQNVDGQITSANGAAERILGLSLDQLQGRTSFDPRWHAIHADGSPFPGETHPAIIALQTGQSVNNIIMGVFHPQDGNYVWININATPLFKPDATIPYQAYTTFEDISTRKRNADVMQARLHLIEFAGTHTVKELLQKTLDEISALVFSPIGFFHFVDSDQNALTLQAWSTRTRAEFCMATGEDSHYPISQAGVWADCAREKRPIIHNNYATLENKHGMPEGHAAVTRELVVPIIRNEQVLAIMGVGNKPDDYNAIDLEVVSALADFSWDIIQQRKADEEIRQLNTSLEQRVEERTRELREAQQKLVLHERLATLGQVAGAMGHELRNPLGVISNAVYFLKMVQTDASEKVKEYLSTIEKHIDVSNKIVSELLNFTQPQSAKFAATGVLQSLHQILEHHPAPKSVQIKLDLPADLPKTYADAQHVIEILENLIFNAYQAMPNGGKLTISAHAQDELVYVAIQDTGPGISNENMKKLFEPLFTTKPQGVGLGLGLAISKKLAEANNGRIEVESKVGVGSTFTLYLPAYKET